MPISTYLRDARLNHYRGTAFPAVPTNYYISLHSADPGLTGASELTGSGYARVAVSPATGSWAAPATNGAVREISNAALIVFPTASANWTAATHFGIWDAATVGNFIRGNILGASKTVLSGDHAEFAIGALVLNES